MREAGLRMGRSQAEPGIEAVGAARKVVISLREMVYRVRSIERPSSNERCSIANALSTDAR
jgi:hypothetical protein